MLKTFFLKAEWTTEFVNNFFIIACSVELLTRSLQTDALIKLMLAKDYVSVYFSWASSYLPHEFFSLKKNGLAR